MGPKPRPPSPLFHAPDAKAWRQWLKAHHATERAIWLVFHKGKTEAKDITYDDALDEALCWGWIDSLIRRIDDATYARKFTRRTNSAKWSSINIARMQRLLKEKRVQPCGKAVITDDILGTPAVKRPSPSARPFPVELERALAANPSAKRIFDTLAPSYRRNYSGWVSAAKLQQTRERRAQEAVKLLLSGIKALLK